MQCCWLGRSEHALAQESATQCRFPAALTDAPARRWPAVLQHTAAGTSAHHHCCCSPAGATSRATHARCWRRVLAPPAMRPVLAQSPPVAPQHRQLQHEPCFAVWWDALDRPCRLCFQQTAALDLHGSTWLIGIALIETPVALLAMPMLLVGPGHPGCQGMHSALRHRLRLQRPPHPVHAELRDCCRCRDAARAAPQHPRPPAPSPPAEFQPAA